MLFKMDFVAELILLAERGAGRGDIFCLDLGLGWVIKAEEVVIRLAELDEVLVAGKSVGGALEI